MAQKVITLQNGKLTLVDAEGGADNFSFRRVLADEQVTVPAHQQMVVSTGIDVLGQLDVLGDVVMLDLVDDLGPEPPPVVLPDDNYSHRVVASGQVKSIPAGQQMVLTQGLQLNGGLNVFGDVALIEAKPEIPETDPVLLEDNFSYWRVLTNAVKTIKQNEQMVVVGPLYVLGQMNILGEVAQLSAKLDEVDDYLPPFLIEAGEQYTVAKNRVMQVPLYFRNFGELKLNGLFQF